MIYVYTGLPGSGKTTKLAQLALRKLKEAQRLERKYSYVRKVYTNIKFSKEIELKYERYIEYFEEIHSMHTWRDCDIFIDELAVYFDSREWESLPRSIKKFCSMTTHRIINR